ncbi:hypothetical protein Mal4_34110 [Maioricimonas rarisocia]|uniref:Uncharacterized protein n=1 Tax=Maioricimonas rarisocia TaxID=2528026 RepID=A0A517Z9C7_9PLAN|nr:hypothetical protein [Maioricimonas rarisocia]QDU39076.1 hypothetical protein Mal4_34110 [Maioricimonas rarisocia]
MDESTRQQSSQTSTPRQQPQQKVASTTACACPVCGGGLVEIRMKLQCSRCHTIVETCCEGGPG